MSEGEIPRPWIIEEHFLPCPFCGELPNVIDAENEREYYATRNERRVHVECKSMGCIFQRSRGFISWEIAKKEWNTRSTPGWPTEKA